MKENANPTIYPVERKKRVCDEMVYDGVTFFLMMMMTSHYCALHLFVIHIHPLYVQQELTLLKNGGEDLVVDEDARDAFTSEEVFELIRNLNDPEHPLTLEQLKVATVRI